MKPTRPIVYVLMGLCGAMVGHGLLRLGGWYANPIRGVLPSSALVEVVQALSLALGVWAIERGRRRSGIALLLILLAVTFGPLLVRAA